MLRSERWAELDPKAFRLLLRGERLEMETIQ